MLYVSVLRRAPSEKELAIALESYLVNDDWGEVVIEIFEKRQARSEVRSP